MELHERIAVVRKAMGLTQEQLGELVGVSRQAVSKWESGQTIPDALTVAKLCQALNVSADYVLLGKEPEEVQSARVEQAAYVLPEACPVCGRQAGGDRCRHCGYPLPKHPPRDGRFAVVFTNNQEYHHEEERAARLVKYCDYSEETAKACLDQVMSFSTSYLARRGLTDDAAQWLAARLQDDGYFQAKIVADEGEDEDTLRWKEQSSSVKPPVPPAEPMSFGGTVLAVAVGVIVALVFLSWF